MLRDCTKRSGNVKDCSFDILMALRSNCIAEYRVRLQRFSAPYLRCRVHNVSTTREAANFFYVWNAHQISEIEILVHKPVFAD